MLTLFASCSSDKESFTEDSNDVNYKTFSDDLDIVRLRYPVLNEENDTIIFNVEANIVSRDEMILESEYLKLSIVQNEEGITGSFLFLNEELEPFSSPGGNPIFEDGYFYNSDMDCFIYGTLITGTDGSTYFISYSLVEKGLMDVPDICAGSNESLTLIL